MVKNNLQKETIKHGVDLAKKAGFTAFFDMPNTNPPLICRTNIVNRLKLAKKSLQDTDIFYALYGGVSANFKQIAEFVNSYNDFFPKMLKFKMFAGHSIRQL